MYWTDERIAQVRREVDAAEAAWLACNCRREGCKHERAAEAAWSLLTGTLADANDERGDVIGGGRA